MGYNAIQLLVLAGIAIFLILRLRSVLGTRDGFEKPPIARPGKSDARRANRPEFEVIEGGPDRDIVDHVADGSDAAKALGAMKLAEPGFSVSEFLDGARAAYEMILMAFEKGDIDPVRQFLAPDVAETFDEVIAARREQGLHVEASFVGLREIKLVDATFDRETKVGEITVRYVGELSSVVRNDAGEVVEGDPNEIRRQKDVWTYGRAIGEDDPNWQLVATGE
jgi:predicted lipid-binding transport protein (Tim44 family)